MPEITRFEVIDTKGRAVVHYAPVRMEVQDEGRTLKVFLDRPLKLLPVHLSDEEKREAIGLMSEAVKKPLIVNGSRVFASDMEKALSALLEKYELRRKP